MTFFMCLICIPIWAIDNSSNLDNEGIIDAQPTTNISDIGSLIDPSPPFDAPSSSGGSIDPPPAAPINNYINFFKIVCIGTAAFYFFKFNKKLKNKY